MMERRERKSKARCIFQFFDLFSFFAAAASTKAMSIHLLVVVQSSVAVYETDLKGESVGKLLFLPGGLLT